LAWGEDAADRIRVAFVSANWFSELGYGAARGRVFSEATDERPDAAPVAVLGYQFWQTRMGGDAEIVGKAIRLNSRTVTVIGVAAADFPDISVDSDVQAWLLARQTGHFLPGSDFEVSWDSDTDLYGRFQTGVSAAAAKASLRATMAELALRRQQTMPLLAGLLAGLAAASAAGMLMRGEPFYVDPIDVPVQIAVVVAFAVTAGAATLGPALRVARRDPLGAIRHE
jgi:hypothetical protein